jgi:hypothetical protein
LHEKNQTKGFIKVSFSEFSGCCNISLRIFERSTEVLEGTKITMWTERKIDYFLHNYVPLGMNGLYGFVMNKNTFRPLKISLEKSRTTKLKLSQENEVHKRKARHYPVK